MNVRQFDSYEAMSRYAAFSVATQIRQKPDSVLGLATGSTPIGLYDGLAQLYQEGLISFRRVTTFNLDEYYGLPAEHPESYHAFMKRYLFSKVDIPAAQTHLMDGCAKDPAEECRRYDAAITAAGGLDLQVLGIGFDGHIGFNEPGDSFAVDCHLVQLDPSTLAANARFFGGDPAKVPASALTMGLRCIMGARHILLLCNGPEKHAILKQAIGGPVRPEVPASILQLHPNVDVLFF